MSSPQAPYTNLALPDRPLRLAPGSVSPPKAAIPLILVLLVVGGFMAFWQVPGILRDWKISRNPVVIENGGIRDGQCKTRKGIFTNCKAELAYDYEGRSYLTDIEIVFVDFHSGDYQAALVISADKPELATLSLGIEKLWNRIIVLSLLGLVFFGGSLGILWQSIRAWRASRALAQPGRLQLLPVSVTHVQASRGKQHVTYVDNLGDKKTKRALSSNFPKGQEPLFVSCGDGKVCALAVRHEATSVPALLDRGLTRIDLTDEERENALSVLAGEEGPTEQAQTTPVAKKGPGILRRLAVFLAVVLMVIVAVLGYWLYYVTANPTQYDQIGMEINNLMPDAVNRWGCQQLQKRFGDQNAPFGCTASDHTSWK